MPRQDAGASSEFRIFETDEFLKRLKRLPRKGSDFLQRKLHEYIYPQRIFQVAFRANSRQDQELRWILGVKW